MGLNLAKENFEVVESNIAAQWVSKTCDVLDLDFDAEATLAEKIIDELSDE